MQPFAQRPHPVRACTGCGARVELGQAELSTSCAYCSSPLVDEERARGSLDAVVPFRVSERGALDRLRTYLSGQFWAPAELQQLRVSSHGLRGVLVPHRVYQGVVYSQYGARVGVDWKRRETYRDEDGAEQTRSVPETEWFRLEGSAARQLEDLQVSASVGLPAAEARALGPYDLGWAVDFDPRLLSGFEAELPSVSEGEGEAAAAAQVREGEGARITTELLPGDRNRLSWVTSEVELQATRLVLLPVWVARFQQGDHTLRLLVNGQSGEVNGHVPADRRKVALAVLAGVVLVAAVALLLWLREGRPA